jgi:hypothetical protein
LLRAQRKQSQLLLRALPKKRWKASN